MNELLASPNWSFQFNHDVSGSPNTWLKEESYTDILVQDQVDAYTADIGQCFRSTWMLASGRVYLQVHPFSSVHYPVDALNPH